MPGTRSKASGANVGIGPTDTSTKSYFVEKIVDCKEINNELKFRVRWYKCSKDEDTFEPLENLRNCPERLNDFFKKYVWEKKAEHEQIYQNFRAALQSKKLSGGNRGTAQKSGNNEENCTYTTTGSAKTKRVQKGSVKSEKSDKAFQGKVMGESEPIPAVVAVSLNETLPYSTIKNTTSVNLEGTVYAFLPEVEVSHGGVPAQIRGVLELPQLCTVAYLVQWKEGGDFRYIFREVAMKHFPQAIQAFLEKDAPSDV